MAIDVINEELLTFGQAAKLLPGRDGGTVNPSTVWRWVRRGCRGPGGQTVKLEAVRLGGFMFTSRRAVKEFAAALTGDQAGTAPAKAVAPRTPAARKRASERAARKLSAAGI